MSNHESKFWTTNNPKNAAYMGSNPSRLERHRKNVMSHGGGKQQSNLFPDTERMQKSRNLLQTTFTNSGAADNDYKYQAANESYDYKARDSSMLLDPTPNNQTSLPAITQRKLCLSTQSFCFFYPILRSRPFLHVA